RPFRSLIKAGRVHDDFRESDGVGREPAHIHTEVSRKEIARQIPAFQRLQQQHLTNGRLARRGEEQDEQSGARGAATEASTHTQYLSTATCFERSHVTILLLAHSSALL